MRLLISIDDGHPLDMKVFGMLKKYGLQGNAIFFIPMGDNIETKTMTFERLDNRSIKTISMESEIGGHTISHRVLNKLSQLEQEFEIKMGNGMLEKIIGRQIEWFAPPRGWTNTELEQRAIENCGVKHYRLMKQGVYKLSKLPSIVPITVHFHPSHYDKLDEYLELAKAEGENGYFHMTLHSWEVDKFYDWPKLEKTFEKLSKLI